MKQAAVTRRRRGEGKASVPLFVDVAPEAKALVDRVAAASGAPKWAVVEAILVHTQLTEAGLPTWWPSMAEQEELPLPRSA